MPSSYSSQSSPQYVERNVVTEWPRGPRPSGVNNDQFAIKKRSLGKRMLRAVTHFFVAVLIGVGVTIAWQSHGDEAKEIVRTWAPSLAWLLPGSTNAPSESQASAAVGTSAELVQQLKPLALDLAIVRHAIDQLADAIKQLAARQEQMSQDIAGLQATEQDIRQKMSSPPQSRAVSPRKPSQSTAQSSATQSLSVPPPPPGQPLR